MSAIQDAVAVKERKRNTGDWRGLPRVLLWCAAIAGVLSVVSVISVFVDASNFMTSSQQPRDWFAAASFAGSAIAIYSLAAIVAALRGILGNQ